MEHGILNEVTYDSGGNAHVCELLLVVGARLCAVVCNKDDLLAFEIHGQPDMFEKWAYDQIEPLLRNSSRVSMVPSNKCSPDHKTPILLHLQLCHPTHVCFR